MRWEWWDPPKRAIPNQLMTHPCAWQQLFFLEDIWLNIRSMMHVWMDGGKCLSCMSYSSNNIHIFFFFFLFYLLFIINFLLWGKPCPIHGPEFLSNIFLPSNISHSSLTSLLLHPTIPPTHHPPKCSRNHIGLW